MRRARSVRPVRHDHAVGLDRDRCACRGKHRSRRLSRLVRGAGRGAARIRSAQLRDAGGVCGGGRLLRMLGVRHGAKLQSFAVVHEDHRNVLLELVRRVQEGAPAAGGIPTINDRPGRLYAKSVVGPFESLSAYQQHVRDAVHLGPEIDVADNGIGVIQPPEPERRIMRYELMDFERT